MTCQVEHGTRDRVTVRIRSVGLGIGLVLGLEFRLRVNLTVSVSIRGNPSFCRECHICCKDAMLTGVHVDCVWDM